MEHLVHFDELDSTNTYLKKNWESLPPDTVVVANKQTAGRGRYNRVWVSNEGGLYFSVLLQGVFIHITCGNLCGKLTCYPQLCNIALNFFNCY